MPEYFSFEDLDALKSLEKRKLSRVLYHYWVNKTKPGEIFEFLDKLELGFSDGTKVVLSANEEEPAGIFIVRDYDGEKDRLMLLHEFGGRIDMRSEDLADNALWAPVVGRTLEAVGVVDDGDNCFRNDAVLLDFGEEKMEIHPGMEGLIAEPFEDV